MAETVKQAEIGKEAGLRRFLTENAKNDEGRGLVPTAMELLQPFFQNAESGQYPLAQGSDELAEEARTTLRSVFGEDKAKRVILVSRAQPFPKPDWMSQLVYKNSLRDSLRVSLWVSLWVSLRDSLRDSLFYYLGFVLVGQTEQVKKLTPLIRLLPQTTPLGQKRDEPGAWLVLVA